MKVVSGYQRMQQKERHYRDIPSDSLTVPDQSMSIRDIINRTLAGLPTIGRGDVYFDEDEDPEPEGGFDLTDVDPTKLPEYELSEAAEKRYFGKD
ncbi:hypothetical protein [Dipodfec virus UOA04_Rod_1021]|nr:hypothetical protein [Dipodfec virus UOA04_Rod_1021]